MSKIYLQSVRGIKMPNTAGGIVSAEHWGQTFFACRNHLLYTFTDNHISSGYRTVKVEYPKYYSTTRLKL